MSLTTLILASGRAPELGYAKANLRIGSQTIIEYIAQTARAAGTDALIVTIGEDNDPLQCSRADVLRLVHTSSVCPVSIVSTGPEESRFETLRTSLRRARPSHRVLVWPVDSPFADADLVSRMLESVGVNEDKIARPHVGGHFGYPLLLGQNATNRLVHWPHSSSLTEFLLAQESGLQNIATDDPRVVMVLNSPHQANILGVKSPSQFHQYSSCP